MISQLVSHKHLAEKDFFYSSKSFKKTCFEQHGLNTKINVALYLVLLADIMKKFIC